jgi:hypothetical protein
MDSGETGIIMESKLYKEVEPTKNIRLRRLQLVGHVMRMKEERVPRRALQG